jgi:hypothetical protein
MIIARLAEQRLHSGGTRRLTWGITGSKLPGGALSNWQ